MKSKYLLLAVFVIAFFACNIETKKGTKEVQIDTKLELDNLRNTDKEWSDSYEAKNMDAFFATIDENVVFLAPNTPIIKGKEAFKQWSLKLQTVPGFALKHQPTMVDVSETADLGYTIGSYEMTVSDAQGNPITDYGKYVTVWKKGEDGKWKVVSDIFNSNLPAE